LLLWVGILCWMPTAPAAVPGTSAAIANPLAALAQRYKVPENALSVIVQEVGTTTPLFSLNPLTPRNPASTIKLLTTFVALDALGPSHVWRTEFYALGPIREGVLEGDLLLKGHGDPWLTEENFWKLLGQLRSTGLREIRGDLLIDDTHFAPPARQAGDFDGQPWRLYNVLPNAAQVNFKAVTLVFTPGKHALEVSTLPALPTFRLQNRVTLTQGACRGVNGIRVTVPDPVTAETVILEGEYARACGVQSLPRSFMTPEAYAHALFTRLWPQWGGVFSGGVRRAANPPGARRLTVGFSPPLAEVIRPLNKWSNNAMADSLLLSLGAQAGPPPHTLAQGAQAARNYLDIHGISTQGLVLENGSGLSRETRITAHTLSQVLIHAWHSRYMPEFVASLSIAGIDGTLRKRLREAPEKGWMHLKSGHLNSVSAVAGYVRAASGRRFVVVFFLNGPTQAGHALGDALLRWTYRQ
ncbi:MAG: hypothetical protein RL434_931, partial [Pseudomonadota bacterium]